MIDGPASTQGEWSSSRLGLAVGSVLVGAVVLVLFFGHASALGSNEDSSLTAVGPPPSETGLSPAAAQQAANNDPAMVTAGEELYLTGCVSCHGIAGVGNGPNPKLAGVGAAAADFYLRTGRMPLAFPVPQPPAKSPAYSDQQILQLVAYVASLGEGPPIVDVEPEGADLQNGGSLFLANCAACHNSQGIGGALSYGQHAPSLLGAKPTQIGEAVRIGPGQMPVFGPETITDAELNDIARYIQYLQNPDAAGGLKIGSTGPVTEGFVAWLVGLGSLLLIIRWITRERRAHG